MEDDSYNPNISSYVFTSGEPVYVDPSETDLVGLNLTAPFIVTAIFKSYNGKSSCLFSITQNERIVMSLCIQPAGHNISRVTLLTELYSPSDSISYLFNEHFKDKWIKIVIYVRDDTADLYVNCSKSPDKFTLLKASNMVLTKDMKIKLAFSESKRLKFEGVIEEINLRTNVNDDTLLHVCEKLKGDKEDNCITGEPAMPAAVGPQRAPGSCVIGSHRLPGQPGPPGESDFLPTTATTTTSFVLTTTPDVKHTLLIPPVDAEKVDDSYTPGLSSYKFTSGKSIKVDPSDTNLVGLNLSAPFIVTAIFKSYNGKSSCLFSIKQDERTVMSLCLQPAGPNISRVTLHTELYSPEDAIFYYLDGNYKDKWTKIVVYVKDDTANLYVNCSKTTDTLTLLKNRNVLLTKDMQINLAFTKSRLFKFEGVIEEINFRTNVHDDTLLHVCEEARSIVTSGSAVN